MAVFSFSAHEADAATLRKAIFRMILARASNQLTDPADLEEVEIAEAMEGLAFDLLGDEQRGRLFDAVLEGAKRLRQQIAVGESVEEPVLPWVEEKLDELIGFLSEHASK